MFGRAWGVLMTILAAVLAFAFAVLLMSIGVIFGGRRIHGSCGGLANLPGIKSDCGGACRADRSRETQAGRVRSDARSAADRPICRRKAASCATGARASNGNAKQE